MIRDFFCRLLAWYRRRFKGQVRAPGGTSWQEWPVPCFDFMCQCGRFQLFGPQHYFVRDRDPETGRVVSARYVLVCECGRGHWMNATGTFK